MAQVLLNRLQDWVDDPDTDEGLADDIREAIRELERLMKFESRLLKAIDVLEKAGL